MWFAQQLAPENPRFDVCFYLEIHGPVDTVVFRQALQQFVSEAEALHIRFVDTAGGPMQELIGPPPLPFDCVDLSGDAAPFQAALHAMRVDASTILDLVEGPLFKYALFKLDSEHFLWYQRYHHIAFDGASIPLAAHRVGAIYSALMQERPIAAANFAPLDVLLQSDAAYRRSARYASDRDYWRDYVAELSGATTMTGGPPDAGGLFRRRSIELSQSLTAALAVAETPFCKWPQLLTAIVAAYMLRMANLGSGVFDFPIAARAKDTRATPGMFANVLPLKVSMSNDDTLATLTQRVDSEIFRHLKHQYFRGKDIRHMLGTAAAPIFGPRINIVPLDDSWRFDGYPATLHALSNGLVNDFAVTVMGQPGRPGFVLHIDANTNLYDDASVAAHGRRLRQFIESVLADPQQPLSRIDLLGHDERRLLLDTWNATSRPYPDQLCIHQLVQHQADRHPDAVAIRVGNESLSYAALDARANQLARHLLDLGVAPETRVAVCAQRTPALVVAMLAIVRAGGAYVPLDPVSPGSRLVHIVHDAAPAMLIADRAGCSAFGDLLPGTLPLIDLDAETPCWGDQSQSPLRLDGHEAAGLAYVIYTSGSTGLPKGVMVEHRQLVNLVCWHIERFGLRPGCASTATAGLAFDATAWEIWPVLASGATLLLPPPGLAADPAALLHWWRDQPVDTVFLVTPLALLAIDAGLPPGLRRLLVGGDRLAQRPAALPAAIELVNNYGPTETTVVATSGIVRPGDAAPTIGRPIANTRIYLLDAQLEPVPLGAVGELYIGGAGVARGYLNQPELTTQRFLHDPFAGAPDARMYRTGDLARYRPDGNLMFLGRNDEQVKIRGFRIEPGEIEVQLATHPEVREAVVLARVDQPGEARLVGYVTLHDGATAGAGLPGELRAHLERRLPDYMVPSAFVHLERLPLNPNGKLDRKALPAPPDDAFSLQQYAAPQGETETMLATLWQAFLGIERVGRHDNFFALGGHSILAARLVARLGAAFGKELPLRCVFDGPTIAQLAAAAAASSASASRAPIVAVDRHGELPLSFAEERAVAFETSSTSTGILNSSCIFRLSGRLRRDWLEQAMASVVARHEILRTRYAADPGSGAFCPVIDAPTEFRLAIRPVDALEPDGLRAAQNEAAVMPDCFRGPLFRATLFVEYDEDDDRALLVFGIHHIAIDAISWTIVWRDIVRAYQALSAGHLPNHAPEPIQYRDYAAWQRRQLSTERLAQLRRHWRDKLTGAPVCLNLPFDRARPAGMTDRAGRIGLELPAELSRSVRRTASSLRLTPFVVLETLLAILCSRLAHSSDVVIGTVTEGRNPLATENIVGLFVNTIPLRHTIQPSASIQSHLLRASEELLVALEHGELPFPEIVSAVNPVRLASHDPLFQVFCQLQPSAVENEATLPGVSVDAVPRENPGRGADLAIVFQHADDVLKAEVAYSVDLFDHASVEAIVALYRVLISQATRDPTASVDRLWDVCITLTQVTAHGVALNRLIARPLSATGAWYGLSPAQQAVWMQEQASPPGSSFFSLAVMRCAPTVDRDRVEAAARGMITQTQSLRLEWTDSGLQRETPVPTTRFASFSDSAALAPDAQLQAVYDWHHELNDRRGDQSSDIAVFHWSDCAVVALRSHHMLNDGWSALRAFERVAKNYGQLERDPAHGFERDRGFLDTLTLERGYLDSPEHARDAAFWQSACRAFERPALVTLLADRPYATHAPRRVGSLCRSLPATLQVALAQTADTLSLTLSECLTALTALYLARVSGENEVAFGVPLLNRPREALDIPGQFAKVMVVGASFDPAADTLADAIKRVCRAHRQVLRHGRYPLGELVRRHGFDPRHAEVSINTLFLRRSIEVAGAPTQVRWLSGPESGLSFLYTQFGRAAPIDLELRFNDALFDTATISHHANRLMHYLGNACAGLMFPVGDIALLAADERRLLLQTWNATETPYPDELCLHRLFEQLVEFTPDVTALVGDDAALSYAALNARANQLAHRLIAQGVRPDTRVAICVERSVVMVVGLLAILKSGGAYVPLDPDSPRERIGHILADAEPTLLLIDRAGRRALDDLLPAAVAHIDLDASQPAWSARPDTDPVVPGLTSRHLAYVIYTSGSTGLPKGVMVEHRQLVNLVCWHIERFGLRPGCASTATAGLAFDATAWEIWPVLASGATLLLPPPGLAADPAALLHWWRDQPVDTAFLVTPLALLAIDAGLPPGLRRLLVGGDRLAQRPAALPEAIELVNNYGPTETTVVATSGIVHPGDAVPTIGRPIANTRIYLLDAQLEPVPLGGVGELYIGGAGVARGYLNQPELTTQRFLHDPFAGAPDARMYRTGDLARYRPDGNLMFLGRNDEQVKIRGFRIEPGEIEVQLATHPEVREAAVLARVDQPGEARLVGYVTLHDGATADAGLPGELRAHLERRLPDYMVPSAFVHLERLPLNPNGKLDRKALPAPPDDAFSLQQYAAPQGETETMLATLWQAFLGIERVGRHDNFFALGGHSLMAARLLNQVRVTFGRDVSLGALFEAPSIALFAERLAAHAVPREDSGALNVLLPLRTQGLHPPLFCIHPGGGFGWPYAGLLRYLPDRPLYALQARRLSEPTRRFGTIETIAADYLEQIRAVQAAGPYRLLGWSLGCHIAHAVATLLQHQNEQVEQLIMFDSYPIPPAVEMPLPPTDLQIMKLLFQSLSDTPWEHADEPSSPDAIRRQPSHRRELAHGLDDDVFNAIFDELKATPALICQFRPSVFDGNLLFFRATRTEPDNALLGEPTAWQPYIGGDIVAHDITCLHEKMLHPEALALIGPLVAAALR
ncbi:amino acid adenylation domain-containing protein [Paraburkholderia bryophila]|uniref:amino acid adenylation domain-containing protein n=1 Tax=Paraburkholderia bryophila TaxID=420952 RepID=UPI00211C2366|nr:non-ribosomal peptide synthetase [Paraburkholderia bryophila]